MDAIVYDKVGKEAEKVREALYGIYPQETITDAAIASFDDGADGIPVKALTVGVEPVQDLHGYSNPWPAGGNINKLPPAASYTPVTVGNSTITPYPDGHYHLSKTAGSASDSITIELKTTVDCTTSQYYTCISALDSGNAVCNLRSESGTLANGYFGMPSGAISNAGTATKINFYFTANVSGEYDVWPMVTDAVATTFLPWENLCPISGHTGAEIGRYGKNLIGTPNFTNYTVQEDGSIEFSKIGYNAVLITAHLKAGTYTYSDDVVSGSGIDRVAAYINGEYVRVATGTKANDKNIMTFTLEAETDIRFYRASNDNPIVLKNIQLERGSAVTDYEEYQGDILSVTFPDEAGTVYGGTLTVNPDRTGTLVVDRAINTIAGLNFIYQSAYNRFYTSRLQSVILVPPSNATNFLCEALKSKTDSEQLTAPSISIASSGNVFIAGVEYSSAADLNTAIGDGKFCYMLKEPVTIHLTESEISGILTTLYGTNNIWADTGNIKKLTYRADLGKYIDSHITTAVANALNA